MEFTNEFVTPAQAREWLTHNAPNNRRPRWSRIPGYARDMLNGDWEITGEPIKFADDGTLLDGQNRLMALSEAGMDGCRGVTMTVARGVPREAMLAMDTGASRTFSDFIRLEEKAYPQAASIVRWDIAWSRGLRMGGGGSLNPTHAELNAEMSKHADQYSAAAQRGRDLSTRRIATASSAGMGFLLTERISHEQAHAFYDMFISGADLPERHPVLALRNRLLIGQPSIPSWRQQRLTPAEQLAVIIRAWNAYRRDKPLAQILITSGGPLTNENFPLPR